MSLTEKVKVCSDFKESICSFVCPRHHWRIVFCRSPWSSPCIFNNNDKLAKDEMFVIWQEENRFHTAYNLSVDEKVSFFSLRDVLSFNTSRSNRSRAAFASEEKKKCHRSEETIIASCWLVVRWPKKKKRRRRSPTRERRKCSTSNGWWMIESTVCDRIPMKINRQSEEEIFVDKKHLIKRRRCLAQSEAIVYIVASDPLSFSPTTFEQNNFWFNLKANSNRFDC